MKNHDRPTTSKFGRRYDEPFKRDAVRLLETSARSLPQLSQELGVSAWSLKRWKTLYGTKASLALGVATPRAPTRPWRLKTPVYVGDWRPSVASRTC